MGASTVMVRHLKAVLLESEMMLDVLLDELAREPMLDVREIMLVVALGGWLSYAYLQQNWGREGDLGVRKRISGRDKID